MIHNEWEILRRWRRGACLVFATVIIYGCSRTGNPVEATGNILKGKVLLDNQEVKMGTVVALSDNGTKLGDCQITPDGSYAIDKLPAGNVKLIVLPPPMLGKQGGGPDEKRPKPPPIKDMKFPPKDPMEDKMPAELREWLKTIENMPSKYSHESQSGLSAKIKEGDITEYDIKMTSK